MPRFLLALTAAGATVSTATAGDLTPSYFDPCQSVDGRFRVLAEAVGGEMSGRPIKWQITWEDTKANEKKTFPAPHLCAGKTKGNLFVPPDGNTIAVWDNVMVWTPTDGGIHPKLTTTDSKSPEWRTQPEFGRRLVIYKKDGTLLKEYRINDFLTPEEWPGVSVAFNRVTWLAEYPGLSFKKTPRPAYAWYQISPDYSVLEFHPPLKPKNSKKPRAVRVDLSIGEILAADAKLPPSAPRFAPSRGRTCSLRARRSPRASTRCGKRGRSSSTSSTGGHR